MCELKERVPCVHEDKRMICTKNEVVVVYVVTTSRLMSLVVEKEFEDHLRGACVVFVLCESIEMQGIW